MAADADHVRHARQKGRQLAQNLDRVVLQFSLTTIEHGSVLLIDNLQPQAIGRDIEQQLVFKGGQGLAFLDGLLQLLHQLFELLSFFFVGNLLGHFSVGRFTQTIFFAIG